jgi:hypothetical protein
MYSSGSGVLGALARVLPLALGWRGVGEGVLSSEEESIRMILGFRAVEVEAGCEGTS